MSTSIPDEIFTEVVNDLMKELSPLAHGTNIILGLITNNINSPVLAEIQDLSLSNLDTAQMTVLVPALANMVKLTSLALPRCKPSPDHFQVLFTQCPTLSKLQHLDLNDVQELRYEDLHLLSQSTTVTNLTSLKLRGAESITYRRATKLVPDLSGLIALLSSPTVKNLTHLELVCDFTSDTELFIALATSPHLANLVSLDLSASTMHPLGKMNSKAVAALAASTTLVNLTRLNLVQAGLGDELIAQLFSHPSRLAAKLQSLDLSWSGITVSSLKVVHKACPNLTELIVRSNPELGPMGAAFIAAQMPNLTKLDLGECGIGDEGYAALAASTTLSNLRELHLSGNRSNAASIIALANSPVLANLTHLDLTHTHNDPEVLTAIAQSATMSNLQLLYLGYNGIGPAGALALAQSTTLTNLTSLDLSYTEIGPEGVEALCTSPVVSKLTSLDLADEDDEDHALVKSIPSTLTAPSSTLYNLVRLSLGDIWLDETDILQLLSSPNLDQLDHVQMDSDRFDYCSDEIAAPWKARFDGYDNDYCDDEDYGWDIGEDGDECDDSWGSGDGSKNQDDDEEEIMTTTNESMFVESN